MERCEYCGRRQDRPGANCPYLHRRPDVAEQIVQQIEGDLNDRRGCHIDQVDADTLDEIRDRWAEIVRVELSFCSVQPPEHGKSPVKSAQDALQAAAAIQSSSDANACQNANTAFVRGNEMDRWTADPPVLTERERCMVANLRNCGERFPPHLTTDEYEPGPMVGPLWSRVAYVFGVGSATAVAVCRAAGFDPFGLDAETCG